MPKKSLTKAIEDLFSWLGEKPATEPIDRGAVRSRLMEMLPLAQSLEDGAVIRDAEAKIETLEAALEEANAKDAGFQAELQQLKPEVEAFRAAEREQKDQEVEPKQMEILSRLPTENMGGFMTLAEIVSSNSISVEEAEVRLHNLEKDGLVIRGETFTGHVAWQRTIEGTKLVLAKRLANEEEAEQRDPDRFGAPLTDSQRLVLLYVSKSVEGVTPDELATQLEQAIPTLGSPLWTPQSVLFLLITLREKQMVIDQPAPSAQIARKWIARRKGIEYLAESKGEAPQQQQHKHPDLMPIQHQALLLIARNPEGIRESEIVGRVIGPTDSMGPGVRLFLTTLRTRGFVAEGGNCPESGYWSDRCLVLAQRGAEYLAERDLR